MFKFFNEKYFSSSWMYSTLYKTLKILLYIHFLFQSGMYHVYGSLFKSLFYIIILTTISSRNMIVNNFYDECLVFFTLYTYIRKKILHCIFSWTSKNALLKSGKNVTFKINRMGHESKSFWSVIKSSTI